MSEFKALSKAVHAQYKAMCKHELFVVGDDSRAFEAHYLASFPPGTNPIYKTNTEHDCSCCKNFMRNLGRVVTLVDGKITTVWDHYKDLPHPYDMVAQSMRDFVLSQPITDLFRTKERSYGAENSRQLLESGQVIRWDHFHGEVHPNHWTGAPDQIRGDYRTTVQLFKRGLEELTDTALADVQGLIEAKALYRGEEHARAVNEFAAHHYKYSKLRNVEREIFLWANAGSPSTRFRNTAIGTLVQDLSEGKDLEQAVKAFEDKVAPTNYKRPSALITPKMVESAFKTIEELGLKDALERRHAKLSDISVNNVLWVNNKVREMMKSPLHQAVLSAVRSNTKTRKMGESAPAGVSMSIDSFMAAILPNARELELFVAGTMQTNFMSLTAPVHAGEPRLFKWNNDFAWSYDGNITDSIKERVKAAGGNVTNAKLRFSLAWSNFDDLDIHVFEPNGNRIYFADKQGKLDVDMNAGRGTTRQPVENVSWTSVRDGVYRIEVDQYSQRESDNVGCTVEIESAGKLIHLSHAKPLKKYTPIASVKVLNGQVTDVTPASNVVMGGMSQEKWGVMTEIYVPVQTVMHSPNYWDGQTIGNKHWFFMLKGCLNPLPARGIYNEFLRSEFDKHRKVFEVLADKAKCQVADEQLSGLGFSSTRGDTVTVRVYDGKRTQNFNVTF